MTKRGPDYEIRVRPPAPERAFRDGALPPLPLIAVYYAKSPETGGDDDSFHPSKVPDGDPRYKYCFHGVSAKAARIMLDKGTATADVEAHLYLCGL